MDKPGIYFSRRCWKNLYSFLRNSSSGKRFLLTSSIELINDREKCFIINNDNKQNKEIVDLCDQLKWRDNIFSMASVQKFKKTASKDYIVVGQKIIDAGIYVRQWAHGDRIITHAGHNIKVKNLLINKKENADFRPIIRH